MHYVIAWDSMTDMVDFRTAHHPLEIDQDPTKVAQLPHSMSKRMNVVA